METRFLKSRHLPHAGLAEARHHASQHRGTPLSMYTNRRTLASFKPKTRFCVACTGGDAMNSGWYADRSNVYSPLSRSLSFFSFQKRNDSNEEDQKRSQPISSWSATANANANANSSRASSQQARELFTVDIAIGANLLICAAKCFVYALSGSSALLAEAIHSFADVGNQVLLRTGIVRSKQAPTAEYPYGYMRDKFIWSLISAVGIFCLGAGVTIAHGLSGLFVQKELEHMGATVAVLAVSLCLEGISLQVAIKTLMSGAKECGMSFMEYIKQGMDPTSTAVMMEDGGAVAGLLVAGASTALVYYTGNSMWDAIGSICVGTLLGAIAVFLIQKNRSLLIGRSMNKIYMEKIMQHLRNDPVIKAVHDAKSEELGPGIYRFKAEIDFSGSAVVQRYLERLDKEVLGQQIQASLWTQDSKAMEGILQDYGQEIISAVGAEVDRIEGEIMALVPGVKYVDLETDRGGGGTGAIFKHASKASIPTPVSQQKTP